MNTQLEEYVDILKELESEPGEFLRYRQGLKLLSMWVGEDFFDGVSVRAEDAKRFDTDGDFYTVCNVHDVTNGESAYRDTVDVIVCWRVEDRSSECPVRISFEFKGDKEFNINVHFQKRGSNVIRVLLGKTSEGYYTQFKGTSVTLMDLLHGYDD